MVVRLGFAVATALRPDILITDEVRGGVPVTVFEAGAVLSEESRASTFHPPTLDMLDSLGAARSPKRTVVSTGREATDTVNPLPPAA